MTKRLFSFFKKIFTNKLLAALSIIFLYLLPKAKLHPFLSESLLDIIGIYLIIYFFLPLFNFFKKDSFLLNGLIFIVGFLFLMEILKILPDENRFIYNLIAIFFLSFIASFIISFIFKIFLFFSKRKTLLKLLLSFIFLLTTLFLFYPPKIIWEKVVELYYQKINKKAGIIFYEKEYQKLLKKDFDLRKRIEDIINYFEEETNFNFDYLKDNKKLIEDYFKQKDFIKKQLLEIDKKQSSIKLSKQYEDFFSLRKKALEEKKDSDKIFEGTVKMYIDALEIYDHFWDFVTEKKFLTNTVLAKENKSKEEFLKLIDAYQKDLDAFYEKKIKNLRIPFFDGVKKEMIAYYFLINELLKIMKKDAINTNTKKIEDLEALKELEIFSQEFLTRQQNNEFKKWREETVKQYVYLYIEKTFDAYHLYKKAYSFAKKNKLLEITKVWGNDYPMKELKINYYLPHPHRCFNTCAKK